jgi:hypothetical protein
MSSIDDLRSLIQDIVAPDIKAIAAQLNSFERAITQRLEAAEKFNQHRFDALEQAIKLGFEASEKLAAAREEAMLLRLQIAADRADANQKVLLKSLDIDRRMELLESRSASPTAAPAPGQHA